MDCVLTVCLLLLVPPGENASTGPALQAQSYSLIHAQEPCWPGIEWIRASRRRHIVISASLQQGWRTGRSSLDPHCRQTGCIVRDFARISSQSILHIHFRRLSRGKAIHTSARPCRRQRGGPACDVALSTSTSHLHTSPKTVERPPDNPCSRYVNHSDRHTALTHLISIRFLIHHSLTPSKERKCNFRPLDIATPLQQLQVYLSTTR